LFSHYGLLLLPFALYFPALMECVILDLRTVIVIVVFALHCYSAIRLSS